MKGAAGSMPEEKVRFAEFELDLGRFQVYRGVSRAWNAFLCKFADVSDRKAGSVATARKLPARSQPLCDRTHVPMRNGGILPAFVFEEAILKSASMTGWKCEPAGILIATSRKPVRTKPLARRTLPRR
jgi:hypothetical protein